MHALLQVGAQLGERVELARGAGQLVVERRQDLLLDLLDLVRRLRGRAVDRLELDLLRLARKAPVSARSISSTSRPEPSSTTRSRWPSPFSSSRRRPATSPVCAGRSSTGASSATDARSASSSCSTSSCGTSGSANGTSSCDQSAGRLRLHGDGGGELEVGVLGARQLVVVLGRGDRADVRRRGGVHEPAADVALDRLGEDALAADPGLEHLRSDLALAEARHLDRLGEIVCRVLDRVLEVGLRNVDRQPDLVVGKLFDLRRHSAIQAKRPCPADESVSSRRARRRRTRGARGASSGRPRGSRPCSSGGSRRCRPAHACRTRGT